MSGNPLLSVYILNWETKKLIETSVHIHQSGQLWTWRDLTCSFRWELPIGHIFRTSLLD